MIDSMIKEALPNHHYYMFIGQEALDVVSGHVGRLCRFPVQVFSVELVGVAGQATVASVDSLQVGYFTGPNENEPENLTVQAHISKVVVNDAQTRGMVYLEDGTVVLFNSDFLV